jgi:hypothetical protein
MDKDEIAMFNMADFKFAAIRTLIDVDQPQSIALITERCPDIKCSSPHIKAISGSKFLLYKMLKEACEDLRKEIINGGDINEKLALEIYEQEEEKHD